MPSSYLYFNDLRFHYLHWNLEAVGQPVILLHGLASNARIWELVAPRLGQAGYSVYAPDLRGHGLTDKPDGDYGFDTYFRDLATFIDVLNLENPVLVGHSWGASLALDYAARLPLGPRAPQALILVDGGLTQLDDRPGATWEVTRLRLEPPRLAGTPLSAFLARVQSPERNWRPDDQALSIILANFEIVEADGDSPEIDDPRMNPAASEETLASERIYPRLSYEHHMQIVRAMWEFPTYKRFRSVDCPVLLLPARPPQPQSQHERDFLAAKERGVAKIQQIQPAAQVQWMEDSIHDIPLQRPAELADEILRFLHAVGE